MLESLDYTIRIGSIPTFLYFDLFMVLQVVVLWLYMSYKFCVVIYLFEYKNM